MTRSPITPLRKFALVDTTPLKDELRAQLAALPDARSLFAGMPEAEIAEIQVYLIAIETPPSPWLQALDEADLYTPCLTLLQSHLTPDALVQHLAAHVVADIGEGQTALLRFYDPRLLAPMLKALPHLASSLLKPLDYWAHRAPTLKWQTVKGQGLEQVSEVPPIVLSLTECETLMQASQPHEIMASLVALSPIPEQAPYAQRWNDFYPRFKRALRWGFKELKDVCAYCTASYKRGIDFDTRAPISGYLTSYGPKGYSFSQIASMAAKQEQHV